MIEEILNDKHSVILVFMNTKNNSNAIIGCVHCQYQVNNHSDSDSNSSTEKNEKNSGTDDSNKIGYFGMLVVNPLIHAHGVGKHILTRAERYMEEQWHCNIIQCYVIGSRYELVE